MVIRGSSEEYGSWNTICSGPPARARGPGAPVEQDAPAVSGDEPDRGPGQGGLAGARLPDQPDDLPAGTVRLTRSTAVMPWRRVP